VAGALGAGHVRADQVVLDEVAVGAAQEVDADALIAGDQVAVYLVGAADRVVPRGPEGDALAVAAGVAQRVAADEVTGEVNAVAKGHDNAPGEAVNRQALDDAPAREVAVAVAEDQTGQRGPAVRRGRNFYGQLGISPLAVPEGVLHGTRLG